MKPQVTSNELAELEGVLEKEGVLKDPDKAKRASREADYDNKVDKDVLLGILHVLEDKAAKDEGFKDLGVELRNLKGKLLEGSEQQRKEVEYLFGDVVDGLKELKESEPKVTVKNPQKTVSVDNLKEIKIPNKVDIKEASWLVRAVGAIQKPIVKAIERLPQSQSVLKTKIVNGNDPTKPVSVRLSDGKKFYDAIAQVFSSSGSRIPFKTAAGVFKEALIDDSGRLQIDVDIVDQVGTSFDHGRKSSIGGTALQITADSVTALQGVEVKAANGNSDNIYIGNSDVTADGSDATSGMELGAGESFLVKVDNANKVYVISDGTAQSVYWLVA